MNVRKCIGWWSELALTYAYERDYYIIHLINGCTAKWASFIVWQGPIEPSLEMKKNLKEENLEIKKM